MRRRRGTRLRRTRMRKKREQEENENENENEKEIKKISRAFISRTPDHFTFLCSANEPGYSCSRKALMR